MSKPLHVGIDVGSRELVVALEAKGGEIQQLSYSNDPSGHKKLVARLVRTRRPVRVVLEATGVYGLDLAMALERAACIQVMVANPRTIRDFARASFQRSKTDLSDAALILEFARRMTFRPWSAPDPKVLDLRALARRISRLKLTLNQERNRLHAASQCRDMDPFVQENIREHMQFLQDSIHKLIDQAFALIQSHPGLERRYHQLISIKGIAQYSAIRILAELAVLPPDMSVRQWVAHAGLDPRHRQSGTSLDAPAHISRLGNTHLRSALFMPAMVAVRHDGPVRSYYQKLIDRGKKPKQALIAVMRKLLHAIYGMFGSGQDFLPAKFCPTAA